MARLCCKEAHVHHKTLQIWRRTGVSLSSKIPNKCILKDMPLKVILLSRKRQRSSRSMIDFSRSFRTERLGQRSSELSNVRFVHRKRPCYHYSVSSDIRVQIVYQSHNFHISGIEPHSGVQIDGDFQHCMRFCQCSRSYGVHAFSHQSRAQSWHQIWFGGAFPWHFQVKFFLKNCPWPGDAPMHKACRAFFGRLPQ